MINVHAVHSDYQHYITLHDNQINRNSKISLALYDGCCVLKIINLFHDNLQIIIYKLVIQLFILH